MSFISGFFLGGGFLTSAISPAATTPYNYVKLNGEATVDKLRVLRTCLTDTQLDALTVTETYTWDLDTLLYAEFSNDLDAGNADTAEAVEGFILLRTRTGDTLSETISADIDADVSGYYDYTAKRDETYTYSILPYTNNYVLAPLVTNSVDVDYCKVIIIDEVTGESYLFDLNLDFGSISTNNGRNKYDSNYSTYPAISRDQKLYDEGSISCLMGYMSDDTYVDTTSYLDDLRSFINNGNIKVIKDRKGIVKRVDTYNFQYSIEENISENPTKVSFEFTEVGAV